MLRRDEVTNRVRVVSLPGEQSPFVTLAQKAARTDGKERTITQKVPVHDADLMDRLTAEVTPGTEIEATIITEWHKNGYTTYLTNFHVLAAPSLQEEQTPSLLAKAS